jgi:hypothetical protein
MNRALTMTACLTLAVVAALPASARTDLAKRITLDVTDAAPREVFAQLARELDCTITVDGAVKKPITLNAVDMPAGQILATICRGIGCEWRFDGDNLAIKPLSAGRRSYATSTAAVSRQAEERAWKLETRLPAVMRFDGTPLRDVLSTIGKAARLNLRPWKDEGGRKVTIDVGGKTVHEALETVIRHTGGEGVVMVRTGRNSWGQLRVVDRSR